MWLWLRAIALASLFVFHLALSLPCGSSYKRSSWHALSCAFWMRVRSLCLVPLHCLLPSSENKNFSVGKRRRKWKWVKESHLTDSEIIPYPHNYFWCHCGADGCELRLRGREGHRHFGAAHQASHASASQERALQFKWVRVLSYIWIHCI